MARSKSRNEGINQDALHVGLTRQPTIMGVTYNAFILNVFLVTCIFMLFKNVFWLGLMIPVHLLFYAICQQDDGAFDILFLWLRTKAPNYWFGNSRLWKASSYTPSSITIGKRYKA